MTDIVTHQMPVYSMEIDALISELVELAGEEETEALLRELAILWAPRLVTPAREYRTRVGLDPDLLQEAEQKLRSRREALMARAEQSGLDMEALRNRMDRRRSNAYQAWEADPT